MKEIEHALDGNICRCTGYRPIHDAFKSFAADASEAITKTLTDIEDAAVKCCSSTGSFCPKTGQPCSKVPEDKVKSLHQNWLVPATLPELLQILATLPNESKYRLVGGNTGTGIYDDGPYDFYIDVAKIEELKKYSKSPLELGSGLSLADVIQVLKMVSKENQSYEYCQAIVDHLLVVSFKGNFVNLYGIKVILKGGKYWCEKHWDFGRKFDAQAWPSIFPV